jgi:hypothetical protein
MILRDPDFRCICDKCGIKVINGSRAFAIEGRTKSAYIFCPNCYEDYLILKINILSEFTENYIKNTLDGVKP